MSGSPSPEFQTWADGARAAEVIEVCQARYPGLKLRKSSEGFVGGCPRCGDDGKADADRFGINTRENVWVCRQCGKGGDAIALVMNVEGLSFIEAVTELTGEPPPGRDKGPPQELAPDPVARERQEERREQAIRQETAEEARERRQMEAVAAMWESAHPFAGSGAERYLKGRGITLLPPQTLDLRFAPALDYFGYAADDSSEEELLGTFPAMVAAIRDVAGNLMGVHRTYLDPKTLAKLKPPGSQKRNGAKKVFGKQKGGLIRLGPIMPCMAVGEGIETTASWYQMGIGPDDVGIAAGINVGNMAGQSLGRVKHPRLPSKLIPDGDPDMESVAMVFPAEVKSVILLGDGDSDGPWTRMMMLAGMRRLKAQGIEATVCFAEEGEDFNSMWRRMA